MSSICQLLHSCCLQVLVYFNPFAIQVQVGSLQDRNSVTTYGAGVPFIQQAAILSSPLHLNHIQLSFVKIGDAQEIGTILQIGCQQDECASRDCSYKEAAGQIQYLMSYSSPELKPQIFIALVRAYGQQVNSWSTAERLSGTRVTLYPAVLIATCIRVLLHQFKSTNLSFPSKCIYSVTAIKGMHATKCTASLATTALAILYKCTNFALR